MKLLTLGDTAQAVIRLADLHVWSIEAVAGEYVEVEVEQVALFDVVLLAARPSGNIEGRFDRSVEGYKTAEWVADSDGTWLLIVESCSELAHTNIGLFECLGCRGPSPL